MEITSIALSDTDSKGFFIDEQKVFGDNAQQILHQRMLHLVNEVNVVINRVNSTFGIQDNTLKNHERSISNTESEVSFLKGQVNALQMVNERLSYLMELCVLSSLGKATAEELSSIEKMRASPDKENIILAEEVITKKMEELGVPRLITPTAIAEEQEDDEAAFKI